MARLTEEEFDYGMEFEWTADEKLDAAKDMTRRIREEAAKNPNKAQSYWERVTGTGEQAQANRDEIIAESAPPVGTSTTKPAPVGTSTTTEPAPVALGVPPSAKPPTEPPPEDVPTTDPAEANKKTIVASALAAKRASQPLAAAAAKEQQALDAVKGRPLGPAEIVASFDDMMATENDGSLDYKLKRRQFVRDLQSTYEDRFGEKANAEDLKKFFQSQIVDRTLSAIDLTQSPDSAKRATGKALLENLSAFRERFANALPDKGRAFDFELNRASRSGGGFVRAEGDFIGDEPKGEVALSGNFDEDPYRVGPPPDPGVYEGLRSQPRMARYMNEDGELGYIPIENPESGFGPALGGGSPEGTAIFLGGLSSRGRLAEIERQQNRMREGIGDRADQVDARRERLTTDYERREQARELQRMADNPFRPSRPTGGFIGAGEPSPTSDDDLVRNTRAKQREANRLKWTTDPTANYTDFRNAQTQLDERAFGTLANAQSKQVWRTALLQEMQKAGYKPGEGEEDLKETLLGIGFQKQQGGQDWYSVRAYRDEDGKLRYRANGQELSEEQEKAYTVLDQARRAALRSYGQRNPDDSEYAKMIDARNFAQNKKFGGFERYVF